MIKVIHMDERGSIDALFAMQEIRNAQTSKRYIGNYPKTMGEWKILAIQWRDELNQIISRYTQYDNTDIGIYLNNNNLDAIYKLLSMAWGNAPDSVGIHSNPGWDVLCDLCSEYNSCEDL